MGVFYSNDAGKNWYDATLPFGLPRAIVSDLTVTSGGDLQASTFGRGIWRAPILFFVDGYPELSVLVHLQDVGDQSFTDYQWAGTKGQSRRLEGLSIQFDPSFPDLSMEYMARIQDIGDTQWVRAGDFCGTRGQSKRLEGLAVRLTGASAEQYDVLYQAHLQDLGDTSICKNGQYCGTRGESRRVEAIRVWVVKR